jgi:hypothetical protein
MLIRQLGQESWESPEVTSYTDEASLQRLLAASPTLIPGVDPTTVFVDEFPLEGIGFCDLVGVDAAGQIVLVECKLRSNPEIRREVVGQLLAYAGAFWQLPYDDFDRAWTRRHGTSLTEAMAAIAGESWAKEPFRVAVTEHLTSGTFRLVFAVDQITEELKRTVLYLNGHTTNSVEVMALELGYAAGHGVEVLVPSAYGIESVDGKRPGGRPPWDENALLASLARCCTPAGAEATQLLFTYLKEHGQLNWGRGAYPSVTAWLPARGSERLSVSIYASEPDPTVAVNFGDMVPYVTTARMASLADALRRIPGAADLYGQLETAGFRKRPGLRIGSIIAQPGAAEALVAELEAWRNA